MASGNRFNARQKGRYRAAKYISRVRDRVVRRSAVPERRSLEFAFHECRVARRIGCRGDGPINVLGSCAGRPENDAASNSGRRLHGRKDS